MPGGGLRAFFRREAPGFGLWCGDVWWRRGPVPEELKAEIMVQADTRTLTRWLIAAAGSDSVEEFENRITRDK